MIPNDFNNLLKINECFFFSYYKDWFNNLVYVWHRTNKFTLLINKNSERILFILKRNKTLNRLSIGYYIRDADNMIIRWRLKSMLVIAFHTYDTSCIHRASGRGCINRFNINSSMIRRDSFIRTAAERRQIIHWLVWSRRFCMMRFLLLFLFSRWKQPNQCNGQEEHGNKYTSTC